jgi:hypothetical protein
MHCTNNYYTMLSRVCGDYIRRVLDWQLGWLDHTHSYTQLQCIHFTIQYVHYTCAESSHLCLYWLPVFQYRRICSPSKLTCNPETLLWRLLLHCRLSTGQLDSQLTTNCTATRLDYWLTAAATLILLWHLCHLQPSSSNYSAGILTRN